MKFHTFEVFLYLQNTLAIKFRVTSTYERIHIYEKVYIIIKHKISLYKSNRVTVSLSVPNRHVTIQLLIGPGKVYILFREIILPKEIALTKELDSHFFTFYLKMGDSNSPLTFATQSAFRG